MTSGRIGPWLVAAGLAFGLVGMAAVAFPILDGDAVTFVPNALSYARGEGLINPFWPRAVELDPTGQGRLTWHGFLFPIAVGWATVSPTPGGVILATGIVTALSLLATSAVLIRVQERSDVPRPVLTALAIAAVAAGLMGVFGRPETLCIPLCAFAMASARLHGPTPRPALVGACLGLLALTSPVLAAVAFGLLAPRGLPREPHNGVLRAMALMALGMAVAVAAGFLAYPWSAGDWIEGLWRHATTAMDASGGRATALVRYLVLNPAAPLIGVLVGVALAISVVGSGRSNRLDHAGATASALMLCALLWRRPEQVYYLVGLLPVWIGGLLAAWRSSASQRLATAVVLGALASPLLLTSAQFFDYRTRGTSLDEARVRFRALDIAPDDRVLVSTALWGLSDAHTLRLWEPGARVPSDVTYVLVQQANGGRTNAPDIAGLELISSDFVAVPPRWLGLSVGRATKSYAFAVYRTRHGPTGGAYPAAIH